MDFEKLLSSGTCRSGGEHGGPWSLLNFRKMPLLSAPITQGGLWHAPGERAINSPVSVVCISQLSVKQEIAAISMQVHKIFI